MNCKICNNKVIFKKVSTRSKLKKNIYFCKNCDFEFFNFDPKKNLTNNKLDISRLKKTGLKIPELNEDFKNGTIQAKEYVEKFIKKNNKSKFRILDIGCSWGYFLFELKKKHEVYGLELNHIKKKFVNKKLGIRCESNLNYYIKKKIKFDYIFLFYTIEYIPNFEAFLRECHSMLKKNGNIILLTPNKNDMPRTFLYSKKSYMNFFYDENSVNYFSFKSLEKLVSKMRIKHSIISCTQGYSIFNFINWFFHGKPFASKKVGGDTLASELNTFLSGSKYFSKDLKIVSKNLQKIFKDFNNKFLKLANYNKIGNILTLKIIKK